MVKAVAVRQQGVCGRQRGSIVVGVAWQQQRGGGSNNYNNDKTKATATAAEVWWY